MRVLRHTYKALLLAFALALALQVPVFANDASLEIETSLDRMEVDIGDVLTLSVTIQFDTALSVSLPNPAKKLGDFDLHSVEIDEPTKARSGLASVSARYKLWALKTGDYTISALEIPYFDKNGRNDTGSADLLAKIARTPEVGVTVHSVVGEQVDSAQIKPMLAPLEDPLGISPLYEESHELLFAIGALVIILVAALVWFWRSKKAEQEAVDSRPAWEKALERLALLSTNTYLSDSLYKEYYSELTSTFKEYLGRLFEYHALDMTTKELLLACESETITQPSADKLKEILARADMIKFARSLPTQEVPEKDFQEIYEMVQVIKEEYQERKRQEAILAAQAQAALSAENKDKNKAKESNIESKEAERV